MHNEIPVEQLLALPDLAALSVLALPTRPRAVRTLAVVESMRDLGGVADGALVIATRAAVAGQAGYLLDIAARLAGARAAALALPLSPDTALPETAREIANRAGLSLLRVDPEADIGVLCAAIGRALEGESAAALRRLTWFLEQLDDADPPAPEQLAELAGSALGVAVETLAQPASDGRPQATVSADGRAELIWSVPDRSAGEATDVLLRVAAELAGRALEQTRRRTEAPIRSVELLLAELLVARAERTISLADRARLLQIPVDGWHLALRFGVANAAELTGGDELAALELNDEITRLGLHAARRAGGTWQPARLEGDLVLIRMSRSQPRPDAEPVAAARAVIASVRARFPQLELHCGAGTAHQGVAGMRASVAEARAAMAAAGANAVLAFDAVGLRRMLAEWYASETARSSVRELLAPLDELGAPRAATAITTLRTYLDHQGSLTATASSLHLHRNAVAYRIRRIFERLEVDPADPDDRLALHLACRARDLH